MFLFIGIRNFKSIRDARVPLRPFQVLVGRNASGKTSFMEAFVLLRDFLTIGIARSLDDRRLRWEDLIHKGDITKTLILDVGLRLPADIARRAEWKHYDMVWYEIRVWKKDGEVRVVSEDCRLGVAAQAPWLEIKDASQDGREDYASIFGRSVENGRHHAVAAPMNPIPGMEWRFTLSQDEIGLAMAQEDVENFPILTWLKRTLKGEIHPLVIQSEAISKAGKEARGGIRPDGSNLPWLIHELRQLDEGQYADWLSHVKMALPGITSIETVLREDDGAMYLKVHYAEGYDAKSWMLSDGTLRFLLLSIIPYHPLLRGLFLIEEPEIGIHPQAIELMMQSLQHVAEGQVFVSTHSPDLLNNVPKESIICFSKDETQETQIVTADQHPRLSRHLEQSLGELFGSGFFGN